MSLPPRHLPQPPCRQQQQQQCTRLHLLRPPPRRCRDVCDPAKCTARAPRHPAEHPSPRRPQHEQHRAGGAPHRSVAADAVPAAPVAASCRVSCRSRICLSRLRFMCFFLREGCLPVPWPRPGGSDGTSAVHPDGAGAVGPTRSTCGPPAAFSDFLSS
eukprot:7380148-Prymnesium_polylepis.2